mmetsp:Transcript_98345/g.278112  ORF Transcript_98345/g.278112 Transcript_98345/m.278112 type:complete len:314 (+) Transcript_98345:76-1017(+)
MRGSRNDLDAKMCPSQQGATRKQGDSTERKSRGDSDADMSPPRRAGAATTKRRHDSDADLSPPRKSGAGARRGQRHDSDADLSPARANGASRETGDEEQRMTSGLRAGLVAGDILKSEAAEVREKRKAAIAAASDADTGRNAETVYRSRGDGSLISREAWAEEQTKKRKKRLSEYPEQELEWGGGLKQQYNKEQEMEELSRIAAQPFARYEPDEKYTEELKGRQDWHDPMKNQRDDDMDRGLQGDKSGPREEQAIRKKPKCPHAPWLNRFGILPGYRWDGKIRGNNYEQKWLENKNHKEWQRQEAWKWDELNA